MNDIAVSEIFSNIVLSVVVMGTVISGICLVLLICYFIYQGMVFINEKRIYKNAAKGFKSTRKPKSVWPHLLALIQDGYLSDAEALVTHYEHDYIIYGPGVQN